MPKTVDEMTIGELQAVINEKRRLAKKAPKLRKERTALLAKIEKIDAQLAMIGSKKVADKPAARETDKKAASKAKATGKRQRGVKDAIVAAVGKEPMTIAAIVAAMEAKGLKVSGGSLSAQLTKLVQDGLISRAGRGRYCSAPVKPTGKEKVVKKAAKKPAAKKSAKKTVKKSVAKKAAKKVTAKKTAKKPVKKVAAKPAKKKASKKAVKKTVAKPAAAKKTVKKPAAKKSASKK